MPLCPVESAKSFCYILPKLSLMVTTVPCWDAVGATAIVDGADTYAEVGCDHSDRQGFVAVEQREDGLGDWAGLEAPRPCDNAVDAHPTRDRGWATAEDRRDPSHAQLLLKVQAA